MYYSISIDYHLASPADLGRVDLTEAELEAFAAELRDAFGIVELFFLKTCNRREFYLVSDGEPVDPNGWVPFFEGRFAGEGRVLGFRLREGQSCVRHLFEVASSLASLALGEPEIAHQIKQQVAAARSAGLVGKYLGALVDAAVRAGKRVRAETQIGRQVVSPLSLIYRQVRGALAAFGGKRIVFVGAGPYMRRLVPHFGRDHRFEKIFVNRSPSDMAAHFGGMAIGLDGFLANPPEFDALISATGSNTVLFGRDWLERTGRGKRRILFDAATPPDIDPSAADIPGVSLLLPAGLEEALRRNWRERQCEIPKAERIIEEELARFEARKQSLQISQWVSEIQDYFARVPLDLAGKYLAEASHPGSDVVSRQEMEKLLSRIGKRLAVIPILSMRGIARSHGTEGVRAAIEAIGDGSALFKDASLTRLG
ncbi:Glutamyl-tRNA reductase [Sulfidibacter corallicola]|uniref:Glutamyl-tRNA reductase n=1 Tax=Sulfidibacter corallicola TaxID=2818388 RepID=A0A8A4TPI4_SULCO|nr:hypothetical protein [Sulfidibacter corallicola]QTD51886.1 hypothetical protein J3U87_05390 [Sulfidibacter corallicola]